MSVPDREPTGQRAWPPEDLISVCIATVRPQTLEHAVASIRRQTWTAWELVVVGQGNEARLRRATERAAARDERIRYVHLADRGLSRARNAAIRCSRGAVVAMTDDDCEAREDWLVTVAGAFAADPALGVVGGALRAGPPQWRDLSTCLSVEPGEALYEPATMRGPPPGFEWYGGNVAIRRDVLDRIGPFDPLLGAGARFRSSEDMDYRMRLEAAGIPMLTTPRSVVCHTHGRRHGLLAVTGYWRDQDIGSGALAAKLRLLGDPRGPAWRREVVRRQTVGWLRDPKAHQLVSYPVRLQAFLATYRHVLRRFEVTEAGLLAERTPPAAAGSRPPRPQATAGP